MRIIVLGSIFLLAAALVQFASAIVQRTDASGGGPEMALRVEGQSVACESDVGDPTETCLVPRSGRFVIIVDVVTAPEEGYVLAQAAVDYGFGLTYGPRRSRADEMVWPDCVPGVYLQKIGMAPLVSRGCLTALLPPLPVSHYVGPAFEFDFECSVEESTTTVALLPRGDPVAQADGAVFTKPDNTQVVPKVNSIELVCSGDPPPTWTPTDTPTPGLTTPPTNTPTSTPTPAPTPAPKDCGDLNDDGDVNSIDATLILQIEAALIDTADLENAPSGDVDASGGLTSIDAALILQFDVGLIREFGLTCL